MKANTFRQNSNSFPSRQPYKKPIDELIVSYGLLLFHLVPDISTNELLSYDEFELNHINGSINNIIYYKNMMYIINESQIISLINKLFKI